MQKKTNDGESIHRQHKKAPTDEGRHDGADAQKHAPVLRDEDIRQAERILGKFSKIRDNIDASDVFFNRLKSTVYNQPGLVLAMLHLMFELSRKINNSQVDLKQYNNAKFLLEQMLIEVRYSAERDRPWALEAVSNIQRSIGDKAFQPSIDGVVRVDLLHAYYNSGLKMDPDLRNQFNQPVVNQDSGRVTGNQINTEAEFRKIIDHVQGNIFTLYDTLMAELSPKELKDQLFWINAMLTSRQRPIAALGILMMLHPDAEVRRHIPPLLDNLADHAGFTPEDFRRLIGLRNWLPVDERPAVDPIVRKLRQADVACAAMPKSAPSSIQVYASMIDGSGSIGLWLITTTSKARAVRKRFHLFSVLIRQTSGINEIWGDNGMSKQEISALAHQISTSGQGVRVNMDYLNHACAHFIQIGLDRGCPPPMMLAYVAEAAGQYWAPAAINFQQVLDSMEASVAPKHLHDDAIVKVMEKSGAWLRTERFASSWFEDGAQIDTLLSEKIPNFPHLKGRHDLETAMDTIVANVLEAKRLVWAERLLWMAIRAHSCEGRHKRFALSFFIVARQLYRGCPLQDCPLMLAIAELTVRSAQKRAGLTVA